MAQILREGRPIQIQCVYGPDHVKAIQACLIPALKLASHRQVIVGNERFFSLRNFLIISRKFFGLHGEARALKMLKGIDDRALVKSIKDDYSLKIGDGTGFEQKMRRHPRVKITGLNLYHQLRDI